MSKLNLFIRFCLNFISATPHISTPPCFKLTKPNPLFWSNPDYRNSHSIGFLFSILHHQHSALLYMGCLDNFVGSAMV